MAFIFACFTAGGLLFASAAASRKAKPTAPRYLTKNIEDVQVGDWVLAKDTGEAGRAGPHQVTALPRNWTEHVVHVQVEGGGEVQATRSHPFYVDGKGWTDASELTLGDRLRDDQGRTVQVERLWTEDKVTDTFNLTVEGVHAYYVLAGDTPVLVHNVDPHDILYSRQVGRGESFSHGPSGWAHGGGGCRGGCTARPPS